MAASFPFFYPREPGRFGDDTSQPPAKYLLFRGQDTGPPSRPSVNFDGHSYRYLMNNASSVPVGQADATVAGRSTDGIRAVGPMNTDAFLVYSNPDDPDGIA